METQKKNIRFASVLNQRSIEFYNSAKYLRNGFSSAVHVIDYCTALSFELKLKSILVLRNKFCKKSRNHKICELFEKCAIKLDQDHSNELIKYYDAILNITGRYGVSELNDRKKLNDATSLLFRKKQYNFGNSYKKNIHEINKESGIVDSTYNDIWENLCKIFDEEYDSVLKTR